MSIKSWAGVRKVALGRWFTGFPKRFYSRRVPTFKTLVEQEQGRRLRQRLPRPDKPLISSLSRDQRAMYNSILRTQRKLSALTKRTKAGEKSQAVCNEIGSLSGDLQRLRARFNRSLSPEQKRLLEEAQE